MRKYVLLGILVSSVLSVSGQRSTYLGRSLAVRMPVINNFRPGFNQIEVEYLLSRSFSCTVGYNRSSQDFNITYDLPEQAIWLQTASREELGQFYGDQAGAAIAFQRENYFYDAKFTDGYYVANSYDFSDEPSKVTTKNSSVYFALRKYLNRLQPAPWGCYVIANFETGRQNLTGVFELPSITYSKLSFGNKYAISNKLPPSAKGQLNGDPIYFNAVGSGCGYQTIIKSRFVLDFQFLATVARYTGNHVTSVIYPKLSGRNNVFPVIEQERSDITFGVSIQFKAGILLF